MLPFNWSGNHFFPDNVSLGLINHLNMFTESFGGGGGRSLSGQCLSKGSLSRGSVWGCLSKGRGLYPGYGGGGSSVQEGLSRRPPRQRPLSTVKNRQHAYYENDVLYYKF